MAGMDAGREMESRGRGKEGLNENKEGWGSGGGTERERGASVALSQRYNCSQTSSSFLEHHRTIQHERE